MPTSYEERIRDLEQTVVNLQEALDATLRALTITREGSTDLMYEVVAVRHVLQIVTAVSLKALRAAPDDLSDLRKSSVRGLGATTLPGVDPTDATIAMSEIAEHVDEIFSAIEEIMPRVSKEP